MQFLPTCCDACARVGLFPADECKTGYFACAWCAGTAHVIPGCGYAERDIALFSQLAERVCEAGLAPLDAELLADNVEQARLNGTYEVGLAELTQRLPALHPSARVLQAHPTQLRLALAMLGTILTAFAQACRSSMADAAEPSSARCA